MILRPFSAKVLYMPEVITFGCRLNLFESEVIKRAIKKAGISDNVIVFNTCAVTKAAELEAVHAIRKAKKDYPDKKIIVTGCAAQLSPDKYAAMPEVDRVLGNEEKFTADNYTDAASSQKIVSNIMEVKETAGHLVSSFENHTRAFLQVQNGCNHRCTFCIIPYARGNSRSVPVGNIVKQVQHLVEQGYKEIVLTGVDITDYGHDLPGRISLGQMIRRLLNLVPGLDRLRLSSIDVAEIDDELLSLILYEKRLMPHLHISLQAGDNMILKRMKRRHSREQVIDFCNKVKSTRPDTAFGADIIAGFPTETEAMFKNTLDLIYEAGLQYLHVFPYSERDNTPASRMPQIDMSIRKERARILREAGQKSLDAFSITHVGKTVSVIIEKNNIGRSENFLRLKLQENKFQVGEIVPAKIVDYQNHHLIAVAPALS